MSVSEEDKNHLIKAEIFKTFEEYAFEVEMAPLARLRNAIKGIFEPVGPPIIDTSAYKALPISAFSEREFVGRAVFALKKINEFNPHFFTMMEQRSINPVKLGVLSHVGKAGFVAMDAALMAYMWKSWSFNAKSMGLLIGIIGAQCAVLHVSAFTKERFHNAKRRALARKYIEAYGKEFMNDIVSPSFNGESLKHMHNKLNEAH